MSERPRILELLCELGRDDTHIIALYRRHGGWAAVAKSNFVELRFREAVHDSFREMAVSYFEVYNGARERTLRCYTMPLDLAGSGHLRWEEDDGSGERQRAAGGGEIVGPSPSSP
jgi:hypothetical protein